MGQRQREMGGGEVDRHCIYCSKYENRRPEWLSRYNYTLQAGGFGVQTPVRARFSARVQTGTGTHPASYTMGTVSPSRGESGRGVASTTHPHLAPRLKKERSYTSTPPLCLHGMLCGHLELSWHLRIHLLPPSDRSPNTLQTNPLSKQLCMIEKITQNRYINTLRGRDGGTAMSKQVLGQVTNRVSKLFLVYLFSRNTNTYLRLRGAAEVALTGRFIVVGEPLSGCAFSGTAVTLASLQSGLFRCEQAKVPVTPILQGGWEGGRVVRHLLAIAQ
jgi:hypothetical protein